MNSVTIIGLAASILTSVSMLPQLIKIIKEKKAASVSLLMPIVLITGLLMWVWYGIIKEDWIIIGSNSFAALINGLNLFFAYKYKDNK